MSIAVTVALQMKPLYLLLTTFDMNRIEIN